MSSTEKMSIEREGKGERGFGKKGSGRRRGRT